MNLRPTDSDSAVAKIGHNVQDVITSSRTCGGQEAGVNGVNDRLMLCKIAIT